VPSGKKFGGVKKSAHRGKSSGAPIAPASPKKFGGVKPTRGPGTISQMESCLQNCPGEWIDRHWIHSADCPWASVLWKHHGKTDKDWHCLYDCDPVELPSGWTHPYDCPFWDRTGRTPFDHSMPHDEPVVSPMGSALLGSTVSEQKERIRRGISQEIAARNVLPSSFEKFPDSLKETGDDLPF
jgi:hypothetical protein